MTIPGASSCGFGSDSLGVRLSLDRFPVKGFTLGVHVFGRERMLIVWCREELGKST